MLIRNQNKRLLMNVDTSEGIRINEYSDECMISLEYCKASYDLGRYSSKEKALLVLEMIEKVSMYSGNTLFQMPDDDEVEV